MARPMSPGDPGRLGSYELTGRLGEGAQGVVYLGRDPDGRQVAVKLMHARLSGDSAARSRFVREFEVVGQVAGFCTAQLLDADIEGDQPYIVSEYVPGPSLREQVEETGPLDPNALIRLAIGTCTALAAIHQAGVVHRDLKPANVLMGPDGPRVIDFGIARALSSTSVTLTSQVVGTPAFMAPEQVAAGVIGPYTDMFAWAGTMTYAATGRPPFGGESIPLVMHQVLHTQPEPAGMPEPLAELVAACLAKDTARRPSASDVLMRLLGQSGTVGATVMDTSLPPPQPAPRPYVVEPMVATLVEPRAERRRWWLSKPLLVAGGAVMAVVLGTAAFMTFPPGGGTETPGTARIALMMPLTGELSSSGAAMHEGAKLAVQEYNAASPAVPIELVPLDTQSRPQQAATIARQIAADKFTGVIGPGSSDEALQSAGTLDQAKVPMISPAAEGASLSGRGWRYWHRMVVGTDTAARNLAGYMARAAKTKNVVVVDDEQSWSQADAEEVVLALRSKGVRVTRLRISSAGDAFTDAANKVKAAGPDGVFYGGQAEPAGLFIKAVRERGVRARFFLTGKGLSSLVGDRAGSDQIAGTVVSCACLDPPDIEKGDYGRFRDIYKRANNGKEPGLYSAEGYDAATAFIHAVRNGHTAGPGINEYLRSVNVDGVSQRVSFAENGDPAEGASFLYQLTGSAYSLLGDAKIHYVPRLPGLPR